MEAIGAGQQKKHFLKNGQPQQALNTLLDAAARLRAEIRWFPGCAPEAAKALVQFANAAKERLPANASSLPAIGVFNALCYTLPRRRVKNIQNLEESFNDLGKYQRLVTAQEVFRLINGDRRIAKFPVVPHQAEVERELAALLAHAKALAVGAVERRSGKEQKALDALLDESAIVSRLEITSMRLKALTLAAAQASTPPDQDKLLAELKARAEKIRAASLAAQAMPRPSLIAPPPVVEAAPQDQTDAAGDTLYLVPASAPPFVPEFCTCCMAPTRETETIFDGRYNARLSPKPSAAQAFPLCPACRNHRKRLPDDIPALCILPIFGVMLLTVIMGGSDRNVIARLILFFVSWRLACLFQFKRTVQTAHIREGHAGFWESVRILHADTAGEGVLFGFTNKEYAALFAEKNGGKVTQELLAKSMKVREFLDASPTFRKRFILCRTIATAAALPLLLLFP